MRVRLVTSLLLLAFLLAAFAIHPALRDPDLAKRALALAIAPLALLLGLPELRATWRSLGRTTRLVLPLPIVAFALSGAWNGTWTAGLAAAGWIGCGLCAALVVAALPPRARHALLHGLALGCGVIAVYAVLESAGAVPSLSPTGVALGGGAPYAFHGNVAKTGEVLLPGAFLALALAFGSRSLARRAAYVLLHVSCVVALALAHTLAGLLGFALGALAVAVLFRTHRSALARRERAFLAALLATGALVLTVVYTGVLREAGDDGQAAPPAAEVSDRVTGEVRWRIWATILGDVLPAHPLLGFGAGRFVEAYPPYRDPAEAELSRPPAGSASGPYATSVVDTAHSDPLQVLAESGLVGLVTCLLALAGLAGSAWRRARTAADPLAVWLVAVPLVVLANACVRSPLLDNAASAALFALVVGTLLGSGRVAANAPPHPTTPWDRAGFAVLLGAAAFAFLHGVRGVGADVQALRFTAASRAGESPSPALLEDALAWQPSRHDLRALLAFVHLRGTGRIERALEEVRRGLVDAPHSIELLGREGDALLAFAAERAADLAQRRRLLEAYRDRQRRILELDPGLGAVRANLARAEELFEDLPFLAIESGLERGLPNEPEAALDELQRALPQHAALFERRERWMERLETIARTAAAQGRWLVMRKAYEVLIEIALDPAERALQVGEALNRASLGVPEGSEPERFTRSYATWFTLLGHERHLLRALRSNDAPAAEARLDRLLAYAEYKEKPWFQLDTAAVAQLAGRTNQADIFLELALTQLEGDAAFPGLPPSRRVYLHVFAGSPQRARLERLFGDR